VAASLAGGQAFHTAAEPAPWILPVPHPFGFEVVKKPLNFHLAKKEVCRKLAA
jgi:hypothetical protein